jgi:CMP-2-keto-3-deoxyoctulosonic acid synthetase
MTVINKALIVSQPPPIRKVGASSMSPISSVANRGFGVSQVAARSRESTAAKLTVTTAEGDKVTLSFKQDTSARFSAGAAYGPDGRAAAARSSFRQQTEVAVNIEGDLSDAELKDIKDLIGQLAQPADTASAKAKAKSTSSLDSIQSFEFAYRRRVEVDFRATQYSIEA